MDYWYFLKLNLIGYLAWIIWIAGYLTYNIIKSRKIFLNQPKEMQEKYKPFYRNDVKNWGLVEPILTSWLNMAMQGAMFHLYVILFGIYITFVKVMGVDTSKPREMPMWARKLFGWHF
jgi:hypothetical protein